MFHKNLSSIAYGFTLFCLLSSPCFFARLVNWLSHRICFICSSLLCTILKTDSLLHVKFDTCCSSLGNAQSHWATMYIRSPIKSYLTFLLRLVHALASMHLPVKIFLANCAEVEIQPSLHAHSSSILDPPSLKRWLASSKADLSGMPVTPFVLDTFCW